MDKKRREGTYLQFYYLNDNGISEITCPIDVAEMKPEHGAALCTHQSHKYDTACFTQCDTGYSVDIMTFSICQSDSIWSRNLPDCKGKIWPT